MDEEEDPEAALLSAFYVHCLFKSKSRSKATGPLLTGQLCALCLIKPRDAADAQGWACQRGGALVLSTAPVQAR